MSAFSTYISGSQRGLEKSIHAVREPVVDGPKIPSWEAPTYLLKEALTPQPTTEKQNLPDKKVLSDSKRFFEAAKILFLPGGTHDKDGEAGNGKFDANKYGKPGES